VICEALGSTERHITALKQYGFRQHASVCCITHGRKYPHNTAFTEFRWQRWTGLELRFAVNYLAGYLLTSLSLPLIKTSAPVRIVNVSSAGQQPIDFSDVMLTRG
jgi:NAD(P)-dependent dehydrogenase (short-subunit alcohol dehydrogenase family)